MNIQTLDHLLNPREVKLYQIMEQQRQRQWQTDPKWQKPPLVSIITVTNKLHYMKQIFTNYTQQSYPHTELIIVLNSNQLHLNTWRKASQELPNVRIYQLDQSVSLGLCLNYAIDQARGEYITKFDDDDFYLPHYLRDALFAFEYSGAQVVGKISNFVYFSGIRQLTISLSGLGYNFHEFLAGGTHVIQRPVLEKVRFEDRSTGEDVSFNQACLDAGFTLYAADPFNYLRIRHPDKSQHTWKISDAEYLAACQYLTTTDQPCPLVER